jgi:putative membrane protein
MTASDPRSTRRAPAAMVLDTPLQTDANSSSSADEFARAAGAKAQREMPKKRAPRAAAPQSVELTPDIFDTVDEPAQSITPRPRRSFPFVTLLVSALSLLASLWLAQAVTALVTSLFVVRPELGWFAAALAVIAVLALLGVVIREAVALSRLSANTALQNAAGAAHAANDAQGARKSVDALLALSKPLARAGNGRASFQSADRQFLSARDMIELAESTIVAPLDDAARRAVIDAAKRVSVVTAVSPRALVDVGYVLFENARLIRFVAETYGCRPGFFGFMRLARATLAHLAVTGVVAMGDTLVQQIVGHGLAARISARLGEGVLNGVMTARIGFAAMDVARPLPFIACDRPGVQSALSEITGGARNGEPLPSGQ